MRLGAPVFDDCSTPELWVAALQRKGYSAAYCPVGADASDEVVAAYAEAARAANIIIAEVGAWSNPLSPDPATAAAALAHCKAQLTLAERIGARCCVNIAGSRGEKWDGPCAADLSEETFDAIVASVREIIDAVQPTRTFYTLETMPWMYPDSADSYLRLVDAIDREAFAAHLDPTNLINCPVRWADTGAVLRECLDKLGARIKSCHAKDIVLGQGLMVHLDEVRAGLGVLDYETFLRGLDALDPDVPLMIEHLQTEADFDAAAVYIRQVAARVGVEIR